MELCGKVNDPKPGCAGETCEYSPQHAGRHEWETEEEYLERACPDPAPGCARSHPHENMDAACERKAIVAKVTNARASHAWRMSDSSLHDDVRCTRCGALDTDEAAYKPCTGPATSLGHQFAPGGFCTLCGCHETRSGMAQQQCPGVNTNLFIGPATVEPGAHYRARGGIEPIVFITSNKLDFLEGSIVKYVLRYPFKAGVKDLKKARDYLNWLIEREEKAEGAHVDQGS